MTLGGGGGVGDDLLFGAVGAGTVNLLVERHLGDNDELVVRGSMRLAAVVLPQRVKCNERDDVIQVVCKAMEDAIPCFADIQSVGSVAKGS